MTVDGETHPLRPVIDPHALDDAGAVCAAMIKTLQAGGSSQLRPVIDNYIKYIHTKEYRLPDGKEVIKQEVRQNN